MDIPSKRIPQLKTFDLDHLGIVAGIVDDIGLVEELDRELGTHEQEVVSPGVAVKAMILNGLGFVSAPLYLFEEFFVGKPTEHLLGTAIRPEHLNDDKLGRVLDKLYEADVTRLFVNIALRAAKHYGVALATIHLDASSFHVHGEYEGEAKEELAEELPVITITHGYSREGRPDLKQFIIDLMCAGDGDVPCFFRAADGNESDKGVFAELIRDYQAQLDLDALFVADSALYSQENLQTLRGLSWLTRVPQTLAEAKRLLAEVNEEAFLDSSLPGYRLAEAASEYGGVAQRWLIVESEAAQARARKALKKRLGTLTKELARELKALCRQPFNCERDAQQAARDFASKLRYHQLQVSITPVKHYLKAGRPTSETPCRLSYRCEARLVLDQLAVDKELARQGRFILATNVLDPERYSNDQLLQEYKAQQAAERGFRFLRDPLFFTSSVFLKTPLRIMALALVMALCLLVYSLGQRLLRQNLAQQEATIRHQTGKQTRKPTLRWVFQLFQAVHLLMIESLKCLSNLTDERKQILSFFAPSCRKYYLLL